MIVSNKFNAGMRSFRKPASRGIISASVLLWDTAVCFLQARESDTKICVRNIHRTPPDPNCLQNRRLGIITVYRLLLDFQRDNTVRSWLRDECS